MSIISQQPSKAKAKRKLDGAGTADLEQGI
jgi:hypothetical protein